MAPFSVTEKINASDKLVSQLLGTSNISPGAKYWYNEIFPYAAIIPPDKFWDHFNSIPTALTQPEAIANALANPDILERRAMRLTVDPTTNCRTYVARTTFGDNTSASVGNWILPALIQVAGGPSAGYGTALYHGDPLGAGVELTAVEQAGPLGEPSWDWKYGVGALTISDDQAAFFKTNYYDVNGLYVWGFRYIGTTGGSAQSAQVYNGTGAPLTKYTVVRVVGDYVVGAVPSVDIVDSNVASPIGMLTQDIANGAVGSMARVGRYEITGFDTTLALPEDPVYVDEFGQLTLIDTGLAIGQVLSSLPDGVIYLNIGGGSGSGGGGFAPNDILTASVELNNIVQDGRYSGNEIQFVVIDDQGHVVVI